MDVIFINSERASFEEMLTAIISTEISRHIEKLTPKKTEKPQTASASSPFVSGVRYNLKDDVVVQGLGFSSMENPVRKIIAEMRKHGIEVDVKQRSGSFVFGSDLNHYLQQKRVSQKSHMFKK